MLFRSMVTPALYQTLVALAFAYAILFAPKAIGTSRAALEGVAPILETTARTLGRGAVAAWLSTTGRLAAPGVAAGALLVLLTAMKELPATLMLRPTGFETLATELWARVDVAAYGAAAPYALTLILTAALPAWLVGRWLGGHGDEPSFPSARKETNAVAYGNFTSFAESEKVPQ